MSAPTTLKKLKLKSRSAAIAKQGIVMKAGNYARKVALLMRSKTLLKIIKKPLNAIERFFFILKRGCLLIH